jgi:hypothetical protein
MPISRGWKPGTPRASSGATVSGVLDFGGGDLLELRDEGRKPVVIPFTLAAVPNVDLEAGRILVDPIAAGLIDTGDDDEPGEGFAARAGRPGRSAGLMSFHATVLTLYPEMFPGHLGHSLAGRALERGDASGRAGQYPRLCHRQAPQCR